MCHSRTRTREDQEEADEVDAFTAEIVLKDVACLKMGVHGAGKESELQMAPQVQVLPGPVMPDMPTGFKLTVTNLSDAAAESLSKFKGKRVPGLGLAAHLNLDGLTSLSDAAAKSLSKYRGNSFHCAV